MEVHGDVDDGVEEVVEGVRSSDMANKREGDKGVAMEEEEGDLDMKEAVDVVAEAGIDGGFEEREGDKGVAMEKDRDVDMKEAVDVVAEVGVDGGFEKAVRAVLTSSDARERRGPELCWDSACIAVDGSREVQEQDGDVLKLEQLVARIQRLGDQCEIAWTAPCAQCGGNVLDPRLRDVSFLRVFLAVCISYLGAEDLLAPGRQRREHLGRRYEFACRCPRCAGPFDDVLVHPCPRPGCEGSVRLGARACVPTSASACCTCGSAPSARHVRRLAREDAAREAQLVAASGGQAGGGALKAIVLQSERPQHYLARGLARLRYDRCAASGDVDGAIAAARREERAWRVLRRSPPRLWAACLERLAAALLAGPGPAPRARLRE
ncbi:unnamed protein product, partial [Prorocentrum cordatum]